MNQTVKWGYDMPGITIQPHNNLGVIFLLYDHSRLGFGKSSGEFAIRYYAKNLQQRGINANTIIPGVVNTDAWNGYLKTMGPQLGMYDNLYVLRRQLKYDLVKNWWLEKYEYFQGSRLEKSAWSLCAKRLARGVCWSPPKLARSQPSYASEGGASRG